jgi:hypothetical protein
MGWISLNLKQQMIFLGLTKAAQTVAGKEDIVQDTICSSSLF